MSAAPCRDGSGTHLFTIGADRCSICGWNRWPEVVDDAPMTAPEATPGRVAGITEWIGIPVDARRQVGQYTLRVARSYCGGAWHYHVIVGRDAIVASAPIRAKRGETNLATAIRIRTLAESALEAHLVEALVALRGTTT
jgi:hypothetical protein